MDKQPDWKIEGNFLYLANDKIDLPMLHKLFEFGIGAYTDAVKDIMATTPDLLSVALEAKTHYDIEGYPPKPDSFLRLKDLLDAFTLFETDNMA